jgi:hypothetical protein
MLPQPQASASDLQFVLPALSGRDGAKEARAQAESRILPLNLACVAPAF